ncbi:phosphinothricin acetyltransferase [Microcella putealis]|uniref:Phosphinothricin acetyltransferase n=1 Tax=Microcella putealis TaxID=337005 RepID=A0A4Q7LWY2_9MICO|nr:GNAT family N-acetyltransferase [Microcella putealis]RZS59201.1 phosphinothricin acetyltransferase [Microcella putealis]TQM24227.1 phosphinothricin acetyltransferase [Microcella putealis]
MLEEEYQQRRRLPRHLQPAPEPEPAFDYALRDARPADLPYIQEIYNHYVANSTVTFDEQPWTLASLKKKFAHLQKLGYPFLVAESPRGQILGFAYVYPWKEKAAYRYTVENSIYLAPAATGRGLGRALLGTLLERAEEAGVREVVAVIADQGAEGSMRLHESFGFTQTGSMGKVGFKFERWLGIVLMQKSLRPRRR